MNERMNKKQTALCQAIAIADGSISRSQKTKLKTFRVYNDNFLFPTIIMAKTFVAFFPTLIATSL